MNKKTVYIVGKNGANVANLTALLEKQFPKATLKYLIEHYDLLENDIDSRNDAGILIIVPDYIAYNSKGEHALFFNLKYHESVINRITSDVEWDIYYFDPYTSPIFKYVIVFDHAAFESEESQGEQIKITFNVDGIKGLPYFEENFTNRLDSEATQSIGEEFFGVPSDYVYYGPDIPQKKQKTVDEINEELKATAAEYQPSPGWGALRDGKKKPLLGFLR